MAARRAWVLNLDADLELGAGDRYQPSHGVRLAMKPHVARLATSLLGPDDVLVDEGSPALAARGLPGRAFCPTPRALAILGKSGAIPEPHPTVEVLRRVCSRAFAASLGPTLPGAAFVTTLDLARATIEGDPAVGRAWRVKHAFGMAGRNQRVVAPGSMGEPDVSFVRAGLARGGVQIEPDVAIEQEYAIHGLLEPDGSLRTGVLVMQRCDRYGAWLSTERVPPGESRGDVRDRLSVEVRRVAGSLAGAGYFGPFGVDAYTYRDRLGALLFQPRSEVNARYSMGFAVGLNPEAPAARPA
jgi:hypothetical protein